MTDEDRSDIGDTTAVPIEQLMALRDGELPEAEAARLLERVAADPDAARQLAELDDTDAVLARLRARPVPPDVRDAIARTLADEQRGRGESTPGGGSASPSS